jgi:hypothetical protein
MQLKGTKHSYPQYHRQQEKKGREGGREEVTLPFS